MIKSTKKYHHTMSNSAPYTVNISKRHIKHWSDFEIVKSDINENDEDEDIGKLYNWLFDLINFN